MPDSDILLRCPHCGAYAWALTLFTDNIFSAARWSDGKPDASMLPEENGITRCYECHTFYWLKDALNFGEIIFPMSEYIFPEPSGKEPYTEDLDIPSLVEAIEQGLGNTVDRKKHLRIRLWWALNDLIRQREQVDAFLHHKDLFSTNLQALDILLRASHEPEDRLMRAEIARETGEFDHCLELLVEIPEKFQRISDQLKVFVQKKSQVVQELY